MSTRWFAVWRRNFLVWRKLFAAAVLSNLADPLIMLFGLGYGLAITELVVAPAMPSITARAGGVMLPITRAIAEILGSRPDDESRSKVGSYLILCAFHANIMTAGMFVTAMAGNPLAVKLAADQGVTISWTGWALAALAPGLLCLALIPPLLMWITRPQVRETPDATARRLQEAGFAEISTWLTDEPTRVAPGDTLDAYLEAICLRTYLARRPSRGRVGQCPEVGVPGQDQPRDQDAAQRDHRLLRGDDGGALRPDRQ